MTHAYDFYKPNPKSEYPLVIGHESIRCYLSALDGCYRDLKQRRDKAKILANGHGPKDDAKHLLDLFDYMAFHTPNCKLVSKSYGRLLYNDALHSNDDSIWSSVSAELRNLTYDESLHSKELEKTFVALSEKRYVARVEPCIVAPSRCGNMYTASLYCSLISLISNIDVKDAIGKTIGLFSYGSGIASTLFGIKVTGDLSQMVQKIDLMRRLDQRHIATPDEFDAACALREKAYGAKDFVPVGDISNFAADTYYLEGIDEMFRRTYAIKK